MSELEVKVVFNQARNLWAVLCATLVVVFSVVFGLPVLADTISSDDGPLAKMLNLPVYQWQDEQRAPRAVVLAIHGLTMHGTVFDACARKLVAEGAIVIAPDLRGYGAYYKNGKNADINYEQSEEDLCVLAAAVRQRYKGLPIFIAGESLGGSMAIRLAAKHAELIDGLILCAPAIKLHYSARTLVGATLSLAKHSHQLDVSSYIKRNFSEDAEITEEGLSDPLIRTRLSMGDLLESCRFISSTSQYISQIPSEIPVLVLQGEKDRIVKASGASMLESSLKTTNKTVKRWPFRGHILIETQHVRPDTIQTIISWVDLECARYANQHNKIASGDSNLMSSPIESPID